MKVLKTFLIFIAILIVLGGTLIGLEISGYSSLQTDFTTTDVAPKFNVSLGSISQVILNLFQGDVIGAASSVINGINVEGNIEFVNNSFMPLYIPPMQSHIFIENNPSQSVIPTSSMWIPPHSSHRQPFNILIDKSDIPDIALNALSNGGVINIKVESQFNICNFTITKNTIKQKDVVESLSKYLSDNSPQINASSYSFSPKAVTLGSSSTASITLSGGSSGTYTLEFMKDIPLDSDQVISSYSIAYDGSTMTRSFSFTPPNSGSFYMHLVHNGSVIWSQPNDSSRLKVN
ncbi:MAG: hypothetical protein WC369_04050 [Dehalococcoidales bacterium]|jgi:hypothetical protein